MKIGKFNFKDFAGEKPIMVDSRGKMLTAKEVMKEKKYETFSLHTLSQDDQIKLTLERYKLEPDFKLGIFNESNYTKDEIIKNIKEQTEFGQLAVRVEMQYCNELIQSLNSKTLPKFPDIPIKPLPVIPDWKPFKKCIWLKLRTNALFCENTTDGVTNSFANYRIANVHPVFARRGFNVICNKDALNTRINFEINAKKPLTVYISGVGHGNYDVYTGHGNQPLLKVGAYNVDEVKGKVFHFLSCRTAAQLGPDVIAKGGLAYAGYDENFTFVWDDPATPVNELDLFKRCDSIFDICMACGFTAQQAYNITIAAFNACIALVPGTVTASWLTYDRDHFRLLGNKEERIFPYRYVKICFPIRTTMQEELLAQAGELEDL